MPFVDTSALYSLMDRSDRNHERTRDLLESAGEIVLTDHVLVEAHRLAAHRLGRMVADSFWSEVMAGSLTLEPVRLSDLGGGPRDPNVVDRSRFLAGGLHLIRGDGPSPAHLGSCAR